MSKRVTFTTITPLPPSVSRAAAVAFVHDHLEMIDLNPLITDRHAISPPAHALPEETRCAWYSLTDRIAYLPGGLAASNVSYTAAFHDLPEGLQTHCYAPMGLETRSRWSVAGSLPGEPRQPVELGIGAPATGLYLREDVDLRCNILLAGFVKKTMKKSHVVLVERLKIKAELASKASGHAPPPPPKSSATPSQSVQSFGSIPTLWTPSTTYSPVNPSAPASGGSAESPPSPHFLSDYDRLQNPSRRPVSWGGDAGEAPSEAAGWPLGAGHRGYAHVSDYPAPLRIRPQGGGIQPARPPALFVEMEGSKYMPQRSQQDLAYPSQGGSHVPELE